MQKPDLHLGTPVIADFFLSWGGRSYADHSAENNSPNSVQATETALGQRLM